MSNKKVDTNKRTFVRKAVYVAPAIVTMAAMPSFASAGSSFSGSDIPADFGNGGGINNRPSSIIETGRTHRRHSRD